MSDRLPSDDEWDTPAERLGREPPRGVGTLRAVMIVGVALLIGLIGMVAWLAFTEPPRGVQVALPSVTIAVPPVPPAQPAPPATVVAPPPATPAPLPPAEPPAALQTPPPAPVAPPETAAIPVVPPLPPAPAERVPVPAPDGLAPAPDPALVEDSPVGPLPSVGRDGRKPWQVYGRPFDDSDKRPRIALIISGLGQSSAATEAAIQRLPGAVTLAFAPYARNLDEWSRLARAAGHEVLLTLPMEPIGYPENDPGPHTLLVSLGPEQNRERLTWLLSRFAGYAGVVNLMGSRFTTEPQALRPVLEEINRRGLLFVDSRSSLQSVGAKLAREIGLPAAANNRFIDARASRDDIDRRLAELEQIARAEGVAVGIGAPYPVTIERVALWVRDLEARGIALAPASAVVGRQGQ